MGVAKLVIIAAAPHLTSGTSGVSARHRLRPNRRASNRGPSRIDVSLTDDHFNVGQKRLLFLARAKVRAGSILILAEGQPASIGRPISWYRKSAARILPQRERPISAILDTDRVAVISEGRWSSCWRPASRSLAILPVCLGGWIMPAI
jgi:hypothetical protein